MSQTWTGKLVKMALFTSPHVGSNVCKIAFECVVFQDPSGNHMTTIKAFGLAFSLLLMSLGMIDPMVLSTPIGF